MAGVTSEWPRQGVTLHATTKVGTKTPTCHPVHPFPLCPCGMWHILVLAVKGDGEPPDPVFLPAELEVLGVPESYRLQRVDQDVAPNSSLHTRTETFLLLRARSQPLVQATYTPFSIRQVTGTPVSPGPPQGVPATPS